MGLFEPGELGIKPSRAIGARLVVQAFPVVPSDFARIKVGEKREYRSYALRLEQLREGHCAVVHSSPGRQKPVRTQLVVVEASYIEPLGAISPESVELEGYPDFRSFRTYFRERERHRGFRQLDNVQVVRFRPLRESERADQAERLFEDLYGRWA